MADEASENEAFRKEIAERIRKHVAETECRLNPNEKITNALINALVKRKVKFGDYYCPCRVVTGDPDRDLPNVCPCEANEGEIARTGKCRCGLFVGKTVGGNH